MPAEALPAADLALRLGHAEPPIRLTGAGASLVAEALGETDATIAGEAETPDIADVVALALCDRWGPALPLYARGADAKPQSGKVVARR
jgi:hypothetical protein